MIETTDWEKYEVSFETPASLTQPVQRDRTRLGPSTVALCVLAGCATYTAAPLDPPDVLALLEQRATGEIDVDAAESSTWQSEWFPLEAQVRLDDGLSLAEANSLALFYAPAVREARAAAQVAGAQVLQAGLLANPQLFVGPMISTQATEYLIPANLSWQLPLWGKQSADRDRAEARSDAQMYRVAEIELQTLATVREAFLQLRRQQRALEQLEVVAQSAEQIVGWAESLETAGEVDAMQLFLARAERDEVRASLEVSRLAATRARRDLFAVIGLLPNADLEVHTASATSLPELPEADPDALLRHPSLLAAEADYATSEARLRLEISKQYPKILLGPSFEYDAGEPFLGIGLGVTLPLFDRNQGNIAAAEENRQRTRERYSAALLSATHTEARARDELRAAEQMLHMHREGALRDVEAAAGAIRVRLRTGQARILEVLSAQRAIARAYTRLLELEETTQVARLRAAVAAGIAIQVPPQDENNEEVER